MVLYIMKVPFDRASTAIVRKSSRPYRVKVDPPYGEEEGFAWVAEDPIMREIVHLTVTKVRNVLVTLNFLQLIRRDCGSHPRMVVTDSGILCPWAL